MEMANLAVVVACILPILTAHYRAGVLGFEDGAMSRELGLYERIVGNDTRLRFIRPVRNANESVHVEISIALIGLEDLDEKRQVMTSHIWLRQRWKNPYVSWNPSEFGGLRDVMIPADEVWTPDITAHNSLSASYHEDHTSQLVVHSDGLTVWAVQSRLETFCYLDLTFFPLDRHNCSIVYGSWSYDSTKLNLSHWGDPELDLRHGSALDNSEWYIENSYVLLHSKMRGVGTQPYQDITVRVTLSRRHAYVIQLYVAPVVTFVLLTPAVFMLPAESAHKFVLGSGLLISEVLLMISLNDVIPAAHHTPPRLGLYYLSSLLMICCSMGIAALVANIWNRSKRRSFGVPSCVRVVLLKGLGRLLCLFYEDFLCVDSSPDHIFDQYTTSLDTISQGSSNQPLDDAKMIREYNSHVVHRAEWRQLAAVVDRTFCLIFWAMSIVFIVAMAIKL